MTIELTEQKYSITKLISIVAEGKEIILSRNKKPIAKLVPISPKKKVRVMGLHKGKIWMSDDFNDELPDSFWFGEEEK